MSTALKLTAAEYDAMVEKGAFDDLDRRIELINGEIITMSPAGPFHADLVGVLTDWSVRNTDPTSIRVRIQSDLNLPELDSRPEPDVLWVTARRYLDRHPTGSDVLLLIEVAESSLRSDRTTKAELYARAGIQEYWIVNVGDEKVHIYRDPAGDDYQTKLTAKIGETATPLIEPNAVLNVSLLFGHDDPRNL